MNKEQSQVLRLLSERATADPSGLASVEGINKHLLGELFRRGHISKPTRGQVRLLRAGAAQVLLLHLEHELDAAQDQESK